MKQIVGAVKFFSTISREKSKKISVFYFYSQFIFDSSLKECAKALIPRAFTLTKNKNANQQLIGISSTNTELQGFKLKYQHLVQL